MINNEDIEFVFDEPGGLLGPALIVTASLRVGSRGVVRHGIAQKSSLDVVGMMKARTRRNIFETVYGDLRHPLNLARYAATLVGDKELCDQLDAVLAKIEGD